MTTTSSRLMSQSTLGVIQLAIASAFHRCSGSNEHFPRKSSCAHRRALRPSDNVTKCFRTAFGFWSMNDSLPHSVRRWKPVSPQIEGNGTERGGERDWLLEHLNWYSFSAQLTSTVECVSHFVLFRRGSCEPRLNHGVHSVRRRFATFKW